MTAAEFDPFDVRRALRAPELLRVFNEAGVLSAADVHVAARIAELGFVDREDVLLAAAFAVRAPRIGHVNVNLTTIRETATVDTEEPIDLSALPWPDPRPWLKAVADSRIVGDGENASGLTFPFRLVGNSLYLDRYWREECGVAADLLAFGEAEAPGVSEQVLSEGLQRLFAGEVDGGQALAAATAVRRRFAVVAGGPGTGKTTTIARIAALLVEQAVATGEPPPLIALAAPTGKAAARMEEAIHAEASELDVSEEIRALLLGLHASTLHRLLGWRPDSNSRFRHNRGQHLPHDVVIVDETSMVSLSLMARLIEAVRPDARLVLVGDPGQLASVEAGAVLGDVVGAPFDAPNDSGIGASIVTLDRVHRFGGGIATVADAIRLGDADAVIDALDASPDNVTWVRADAYEDEEATAAIRAGAVKAAKAVLGAALSGDARQAITRLGAYRLLCAHRRGPHGVSNWTTRIEGWLGPAISGFDPDSRWYPGRPILVTQNDYELQLYNGDTGVIVKTEGDRVVAAFERRGEIVEFSPTRLGAIETVYAMTIHKSQGSQFDTAAVLLPPPTSRILSRELLYTAVTRAQEQLILVGSEESLRAAVDQPVARASGLRRRLWPAGGSA